jgi:methylphosphotriester-DNA--protein-cysteine methyltransferase
MLLHGGDGSFRAPGCADRPAGHAGADEDAPALERSVGVEVVLNRYRKATFHEILNRHRVEDVKARLLDPASDRYTVEGIGASAGFRSRSALYAAFRRLEGITPTEFRKRRA